MPISLESVCARPLSLAVLLLLAACNGDAFAHPATTSPAAEPAIDAFFARFTDRWVENDPNLAVASAYFSGGLQNRMEQQLTPVTRAYDLQRIALARDELAALADLDLEAGTPVQRQAAELLRYQMEKRLAAEPWLEHIYFPMNQMNGINVTIPNALTVTHPFQTAANARNYVVRLGQVPLRMREAIARSAAQADQGIVPPDFIIDATLAQMERFIAVPADENPLTTTLLQKTEHLPDLDAEERASLAVEAARIVANDVYPAWREGLAELRRQRPLATADAGLWRFPDGAAIYAERLKNYTTTDLSAEDIHQLGLQEVARIEAEMDQLFRQVGLETGTIKDRAEVLRTRLAFADDDSGRAQLMARIDEYLADALERSAALFDKTPQAAVIAQPYPRFRWENAAASYTAPPADGSRPGIFQMPLRANRLTDFSLRSLVYHETVPGHHFQIALQLDNPALPRFRQMSAIAGNSAIIEGWALYAERLAAESGWYEGDIEGLIGQLESSLFRARRLVVDTGLHAKGWTRQQAIDYGIAPSEVERYVVVPGQATSYMVGQLKIRELRERAKAALGDRFSIREFHNVVLEAGFVPLTMLERLVDAHITEALGRHAGGGSNRAGSSA
jgi:uncharacterized protein (DUF885 family)